MNLYEFKTMLENSKNLNEFLDVLQEFTDFYNVIWSYYNKASNESGTIQDIKSQLLDDIDDTCNINVIITESSVQVYIYTQNNEIYLDCIIKESLLFIVKKFFVKR